MASLSLPAVRLSLPTATMYVEVFGVLSAVCVAVRWAQYSAERREHSASGAVGATGEGAGSTGAADFGSFQRNYLLVYLLAVASDWLQGPYVYALYSSYGYDKAAIGQLFIAGFGSSALFGTFVGSVADKYGRRSNVLFFVLTYGLSCVTKHSPDFKVLMVGRILGGIATSILFSAFESWLVYEHNKRGYEPSWLSETFSKAQFGNAIVAIVSGQVAGAAAGVAGKVAPFDVSLLVLVITGVVVAATWTENYGDSSQSVGGGLRNAWRTIMADEKIVLVGIVQSCFEGAMYTFVFMWTPALQTASDLTAGGKEIPHGMIFSTFMVAIMIGSSLFTFLSKRSPEELFLRNAFAVSVGVFAVATLTTALVPVYIAFLLFEVVCGVYFPAMATVRSRYVPEETRSATLNFYRVPLNAIVVFTLYKNWGTIRVLQLCALLLLVATCCQHRLYTVSKVSIPRGDDLERQEERREMIETDEAGMADAIEKVSS